MKDNKIVFNFFGDKNEVLKTFADYLGVNKDKLRVFIENREIPSTDKLDSELEAIQNEFNINLDDKQTDNVYIIFRHITTTRDNFESLRKYGLRDLQFALEGDTPLNKFLDENGIAFDVKNNKMFIDGSEYNIVNSSSAEESKRYMSLLYRKFNHDKCQIEGFSQSVKKELDYRTPIKSYPEILLTIDNFLNSINKSKDLGEKWKSNNNDKYYILEFDVAIKDLNNYKNMDINQALIERCYSKIKYDNNDYCEQIVNKEPIPFENIKIVPFDI